MSLYDKSSLIQVPSLYKDGTLVSTIPEDRSGDFTVVRGSNLSATRVGEDGYIKKGYENLLLHSNQFDTSPWVGNASVTSGQSGYDGSNDAWKAQFDSNFRYIGQVISGSSINTFSVYAKAGTTEWIRLSPFGTSPSQGAYFNIALDGSGSVGYSFGGVETNIDYISNGWYRCSITIKESFTSVNIIGSDAGGSTSTSGEYCYIQDAMLNQGLAAYPYLETTTAPVQGGLLENTPRLDWSNGVPAVKLEEERTNFIEYSEYFDSWTKVGSPTITNNYGISPEGVQNSTRFETTSDRLTYDLITINANETFSIYMKGSGTLRMQVGSDNFYPSVTSEWVRYEFTTTQVGTRNVQIRGNGSAVDVQLYGAQYERNDYPTSYIPTYGTTQTRSSETISDNFNIPTTATIYNSFYSDVAETVFVLDQVFDVVEGLNKVAIAFSPTAVKISVGGSIVANATGTYDTSSLTNIQLGSDNGSDYSNAPISGFYVFPEFLTDEELNSLTA